MVEPAARDEQRVARTADGHVGRRGSGARETGVVGREGVEVAVGASVGGRGGVEQVVLAGRVENELLGPLDLNEQ